MQIYVETSSLFIIEKKIKKYPSDSFYCWRVDNNLSQTEIKHQFENLLHKGLPDEIIRRGTLDFIENDEDDHKEEEED